MIQLKIIIEIICLSVLFWLEGVFPFFEGRQKRLYHTLTNLSLTLLNRFVIAIFLSGFTLAILHWSAAHPFGLLHHLPLGQGMKNIAVFFLFDLWMYLWHRMNHQWPLLWRFHSVHHSDLEMDASTTLRFHTGEIIFSTFASWLVIPVLGMNVEQLVIYHLCLQPIVLFHHSNVALPEKIDRFLRAVIVTPNMHRLHHSQERFETDSNYSSIFSFWDRMARTLRRRENLHTLVYGLPYLKDPQWQTLRGLFKIPFVPIPQR